MVRFKMSKYDKLWNYIKENNKDNIYFMGIVNKPVEIINEENIEE